MKGKKHGIIISIVVLIIATSFLVIFAVKEIELGINISAGILTSSFVTLVISISDYLVEKRSTLENYYDEIGAILSAFNEIKYVHINEKTLESARYIKSINFQRRTNIDNKSTKNDNDSIKTLLEYYNKIQFWDKYMQSFSEKDKIEIILCEVDKDYKDIIKAMDTYLKIEKISYSNVEKAFGRIDFLFDISKLCPHNQKLFRVWIYENLHKKIRDMLNIVQMENYHIKKYKEGSSINLYTVAEKIKELNEKLFEIKFITNNGYEEMNVYAKFLNDEENQLECFRAKIYNCEAILSKNYLVYSTQKKIKQKESEHNANLQ